MSIIFNGEALVAHHHAGERPFLVVTFIGAYNEDAAESRYLLREAAEAHGFSCVGITTRVRNLYINDELDRIAELVRSMREPDQRLVVVGQSSGGYAAVKFASLFGADCVVTFSPIFSIEEHDLGLKEDDKLGRQVLEHALRFHRIPPEIVRRGMHPTVADCPCPVLFVYDTVNESDSYAADLFEKQFPHARFVRAPHAGHAVFNNIGNADFVMELLELLVADDHDGACVLLRRATRNSDVAIADLIGRIARWRPRLALRALETPRARDHLLDPVRRTHVYNAVLAYELAKRGEAAEASVHLRRVNGQLFGPAATDSGLYAVISIHGDILGYDTGNTLAVLSPHTLHDPAAVPVLLDTRGPVPRTIIQLRAGDIEVSVDGGGATVGEPLFLHPTGVGDLVAIGRGELYLRGEPFSAALFTARENELDAWERFALIPVADLSTVLDRSPRNWLDDRIVAVRVEDARHRPTAALAETAARKARFRSFFRLFGN